MIFTAFGGSTMAWTSISPERAKAHPLYGINGWLMWYAIFASIAIATLTISGLLHLFHSPQPKPGGFVGGLIMTAMYCLMLYCLFRRRRMFRTVAITTLLLMAGLHLMSSTGPNLSEAVSLRVLLLSTAWIFYFQLSRRVRVTFEYLVRDNDPLAQGEQADAVERPAQSSNRAIAAGGTIAQQKSLPYRIAKAVWIGTMIVAALVVAGPTLQKQGVPIEELTQAKLRGLYVALLIFFIGMILRNLYLKKFRTAVVTFVLLTGFWAYLGWQHQRKVNDNAAQMALLNQQVEDANKNFSQEIEEMRKIYHSIAGSITFSSAARSKLETDEARKKLATMESIVNDIQRSNERAWRTRMAIISESRIPMATKAAAISMIKDKQDKSGSLQRRFNQLGRVHTS